MYLDDEHRCFDCDSRHCWNGECRVPGNVYVVGHGWTSPDAAAALEKFGWQVHWYEVVPAA